MLEISGCYVSQSEFIKRSKYVRDRTHDCFIGGNVGGEGFNEARKGQERVFIAQANRLVVIPDNIEIKCRRDDRLHVGDGTAEPRRQTHCNSLHVACVDVDGCLQRVTSRHAHVIPAVGVVALVASGCGHPTAAMDATERCTGRATPVASKTVVRIFRKHGFSVRSSTTSRDCKGFEVTDTDEAPGFAISNTADDGRSPADEGTLYCLLRQGPIWGTTLRFDGKAKPSSPTFGGKKAEASFANLECKLYPDDRNARDRIRVFRQAMRELAATE